MEIQFGPNSVDEPNLLYKLQRKLKVFNTTNPLPKRGYNLVASSSKYGLVFITTPEGMLCVYYVKQLIDKDCEPQHLTIPLPMHPTHIAVNCNQEWLAVISGPLLLVYKCLDFQNQDIRPSVTMQLQINPSAFVSSLQWNPCIPDTIGIVFFDGTLLVSQVSTMQVKKIQCNARCLCWSPKGKQLVTGNSDGTLSQYKPDLSLMKMIPTPNLFEGAPVEALSIYWISTYQFAVSFRNASNNSRPAVTIVNTPKGGSPSCFNYEDICYSMGSNRPWYYYLIGLAQWNIILSSSSNSMEIATLASVDGAKWAQWCQSDEARPELPLTDRKQENYPVGICIDTAAVHQLPWGENEVLQPMPLLHVVSQTGLLTIFNIINLNKQSPQLCTPPQQLYLPEPALSKDIPGEVPPAPPAATIPQPKPPVQQAPQQMQPQQQSVQPQMQPQVQPVQPQVQPSPPQHPQPVQVQPQPPKPVPPQPQQQLQQPIIVPKPQMQQPAIPSSKSVPTSVPVAVMKSTIPVASEAENSVQTQKQSQIQVPKSQTPSAAVNAALKQEQERISKAKAEQELRQMLIKEVNDFQMELYRFMKSTREKQDQFDRDLQSGDLNLNIDIDPQKLKKECEIEDLCESIAQLKLDLVRACAVVAEARAHAEANELQDWRQADPLTTKRLASINKMIYYIQNQLDQSRKALDFKWNDIASREQYTKPGERMIRPILDDVYQPLVKQQEILCRQQAVLKTLKNTLNEYDLNPVTKSTSLLRSTPFRNKDPLSKLTKNILNMSIESQTKSKNQLLSSQKLDALRDFLSNHKPIKIKPVNVELRQHLETLKKRYEKSLKEKNEIKEFEKVEIKKEMPITQKIEDNVLPKPKIPISIKTEPKSMFGQNVVIPKTVPQNIEFKKEASNTFGGNKFSFFNPTVEAPKPDVVKESPVSVPSFAPPSISKPAVQGVVRTLFTDEPKQEKPISYQQNHQLPNQQSNVVSENTKTLLRKLILKDPENKQESKTTEQKNDANIFMGQNICSPTAFGFSKPTSAPAPFAVFPKPIADMTNMFNKLEQPISKQSDETGEHEARSPKPKPDDKTMTNIFSMKPLSGKNQNVPDIIKSPSFGRDESKAEGKSKQNIQEKPVEVKKDDLKPLVAPMTSKPQAQSVIVVDLKKPAAEAKIENFSPTIFKTSEAVSPPTVATAQTPASDIPTSNVESSKPLAPKAPAAAVPPSDNEPKTEAKVSDSTKPSDLSKAKSDITPATVIAVTPTTSVAAVLSSPPNVTVTSGDKPTIHSTPSSTSIFDTATKQTNFGNQPSAFVPNSASSVFATASAAAFGTQASSFGTTNTVFGTTATTSQSIFGTTPATAATASIFGTTTTTTTPSLFGGGTSSAQSLFSAAASKSLFGTNPPSSPSVFGATTTQSALFGSTPSVFSSPGFGTPSTQASLFGSPPATQASVFGTPATTQTSVFGTSAAQTSVFGSPSTTQASVFGSSATTPSSVFASTNASQASVFGTPPTTQTSLFGGAEANLFAAANISTTSAPSQTSGGNIFGGSSGSVFGNSNATNVFGGKSAFGTSTFGQTPATDFWSGGDKSGNSGFGTSTFGQQASTQSSSVFGSGSFSAASSGAPFGSPGPFSGEKSSVFGTPTQQTAPAFGGSPGFGSKPVFGGSPGFGAPSFGSGFNKSPSGFGAPASFGGSGFGTAAFGNTSPGKMFGNSSPGFGSPPQQSNSTFENLATQNTLTFGNLAQQSGQPPSQPPSFNTSPSFTGWRG